MGSQEQKTAVVSGKRIVLTWHDTRTFVPCHKKYNVPRVSGTNPHWNASMQFLIKDLTQDILCLTVFDRDFFSPDGGSNLSLLQPSHIETFNFIEFLGRTEIRVSDIVGGCEDRRGPVTRTLKLLEAESGVISVKLDIQLF